MDAKKLFHLYNQAYFLMASNQGITSLNSSLQNPENSVALTLAAWIFKSGNKPHSFEEFSKEASVRITEQTK